MGFISWNENYSVAVKEIDDQHKQLVDYINRLHEAMRAGKGKHVVGEILDSLFNYAGTHFETEEKYFDKFGYPQADAHIKEHRDFVKEITQFKDGFDRGKLFLSIEIMDFLKSWLIKHILASDKDYTSCFKENGLS